MRHVRRISTAPVKAQSEGVCEAIESDFQARLCFSIQFLTGFLLPVLQLKDGEEPAETTTT